MLNKEQCPNKNICGSCAWSLLPYEEQLNTKISDINKSLAKVSETLECSKIIPSPKTSHYRNRMDFVIDYQGKVGLREKGKWWRVIDDHTCFIADARIEDLFHKVRDWVHTSGLSYFDRKAYTGFLRYAVIRSTSKGESMVNLITSSPSAETSPQHIDAQLLSLSSLIAPATLLWSINNTKSDTSFGEDQKIVTGAGYIEEIINGNHYRISPDAFFQTNSSAASVLQDTVLDLVKEASPDNSTQKILDLYCGTGFFSIPLVKFGNVLGIELSESAIRDANINASLNGISSDSLEFRAEKAEDLSWLGKEFDLMLVDPPRAGLHSSVTEVLIKKGPPSIIYVSCNHESFARDMTVLSETYYVHKALAVDMFPQTPHVELVTLLKKKP